MTDEPRELPDWHTICRWRREAEDGHATTWKARCLDLIALLTEANAIIEQCTCGAADEGDDDEA